MSLKFTPKTEKEIQEESLMDVGQYSFKVISASNELSKSSGNQMIKLKLHIYPKDPDESPRVIFDYLTEKMAFKIRHFCKVTGQLDKYESGSLDALDCEDKEGRCFIGIQKDKTGDYSDKNVIKDYIFSEDTDIQKEVLHKDQQGEDPFK